MVSNAGTNGMEFSNSAISGQNRILNYNRSTSAYVPLTVSSSELKFDIGASEAMRIDSSGNVLVGETNNFIATSTSATGLALTQDGRFTLSRSAGTPMNVNKIGDDGALVDFWKTGAHMGSIGVAAGDNLYIGSNAANHGGIYMNDNGVLPMSAGAVSDNTKDLGNPSFRWNDLFLGGGVYLGGTGSTNRLDDYEQGTWTPVVKGTTSVGTGTYSSQTATYIKVGKLVHITCRITWSAHTGSGGLTVHGWPFMSASNNQTGFNIMSSNMGTGGSNRAASMHIGSSGTTSLVFGSADATTWLTPGLVGAADIIFNGTYTAN
jgi:hypothetical protein